MKTKTNTKAKVTVVRPPASVFSARSAAAGPVTVGLDLGDKKHSVCVLDAAGAVLCRERISNERMALRALAAAWPGALFVMEVGAHSPWISRYLQGLGCRVIVANARKVRAIYKS